MKSKTLASTLMFTVAAFSVSTTALAEPSVEELGERLERMQQEMDLLKKQLENRATKEEVQIIK
jgi:hypothetical protein